MRLDDVQLGPGGTLCDGRFQIERELGAGGMGVVYAAYDHDEERWVAIKLLRRVDAEGQYRIKREFRGFADLHHPGLLRLYELIDDGGRLFFTMELVDGEMLLDALHGSITSTLEEPLEVGDERSRCGAQRVDLGRTREVFRQVAEALYYLHAAGKVHRDLKPDNVLVARGDRTVLLDFGIGASRELTGAFDTTDASIVGTPAYMAPEALDAPGDVPGDWYAFGAMLYEALSGELPYDEEHITRLCRLKRKRDPVPLEQRDARIPAELCELVMDLLARDPARRPDGRAVLQRLAPGAEPLASATANVALRPPFVGREREQRALASALSQVRDGVPRVALVHGPSGIGKSALARQFLREHAAHGKGWLLSARCYERESVRFRAFDGLVDALSRRLSALRDEDAAALMPRHLGALVAVFPVLARVPVLGVARRPGRFELPADPIELRQLAFAALRELLARVALQRPLTIYIDDLQWGDADSAVLLRTLVTGEEAPAIFVLCTYRRDDAGDSPFVQALTALREEAPEVFVSVPLKPLPPEEASSLVQLLATDLAPDVAEELAREAGGSPFLLTELLRQTRGADGRALDASEAPDVAAVLGRRLDRLSPAARELLELLAVAARPLERAIYGATREDHTDIQEAIIELRAARLVRTGSTRNALATYHDRIREVTVERMSGERRRELHRRLACVLEAQRSDLDALAHHWAEAGDLARAAAHAQLAASHAVSRLAFGRGAALYRLALQYDPEDVERQQALRRELATALIYDGRRAEAADVYLQGAEGLPAEEAAGWRQRAGQQLLMSGHFERGAALLRDVLAVMGTPLLDDLGEALEAWGRVHARLWERGLACEPRTPEEVPDAVALRLDTLWAAGFGLNRVGGIRVYAALAQHLLEALDGGDTLRTVRGLCMYHLMADYPSSLLGAPLLGAREVAESLAAGAGDPHCDAWVLMARGAEHLYAGEPEALPCFQEAETLLHDRCVGAAPDLGLVRSMLLGLYMSAGAWDLALEGTRRFALDSASRDDRLHDFMFDQQYVLAGLMSGDLEGAALGLERVVSGAKRRHEDTRFPVRFLQGHLASALADLPLLEELHRWAAGFARSPEGRLPNFRAMAKLNQARIAASIAELTTGERRQQALEEAERALVAASKVGHDVLVGAILIARAGVTLAQGRREIAITLLDACIDRQPPFGRLVAELARFHRGQLTGAEAGAAEARDAEQVLHGLGVVDIRVVSAALAPLLGAAGSTDGG